MIVLLLTILYKIAFASGLTLQSPYLIIILRMWNLHLKNIVFFPLDQIEFFSDLQVQSKKQKFWTTI